MKIIVSTVLLIFIGFHSIAQTDSLNDKQIKDKVLQEIQQSLDKRTMSVDSTVGKLDQRLDALDKSIAATKDANVKADKLFLRVQALEDKQKAIEQNELNIYQANFQSAIVNLVSMDREIKPLILFNTTKTFFDQLDAAGNPLNYDGYRNWFAGFNKYIKDNKNNEPTLELSSNLLTFAGCTTQAVPVVGPISSVLFASMSTYVSSISKKNKELREQSKEMITLTMKISQFDYDKQETEHEWKVITDELNNLQSLYQNILTKDLSLLNVNTTEFREQFTNESDADKRYQYLTVLRQKASNYVLQQTNNNPKDWKEYIYYPMMDVQSTKNRLGKITFDINENIIRYDDLFNKYKNDSQIGGQITNLQGKLNDLKNTFDKAFDPLDYISSTAKMYKII
jgi:hypothetical protein